jgi:hypothetical protein
VVSTTGSGAVVNGRVCGSPQSHERGLRTTRTGSPRGGEAEWPLGPCTVSERSGRMAHVVDGRTAGSPPSKNHRAIHPSGPAPAGPAPGGVRPLAAGSDRVGWSSRRSGSGPALDPIAVQSAHPLQRVCLSLDSAEASAPSSLAGGTGVVEAQPTNWQRAAAGQAG